MASVATKSFKWAICSTGKIAQDFAHAIRQMPGHEVVAVASRSRDSARAFADRVTSGANSPNVRVYGSYVDMARDSGLEVDATYVATPPSTHASIVLELMANRRATLCEKPLAASLEDVRRCYDAARESETLLMEGVWTRFFPATVKARELLTQGAVGRVVGVQAEFGYDIAKGAPEGIRCPLKGGMTRDIGIYLIEKALLAYPPAHYGVEGLNASAVLGVVDGVDLSVAASLRFADSRQHSENAGGLASLLWTGLADTPETARILGTEGSIYFDKHHHTPTSIVVRRNISRTESVEEVFDFPQPAEDGLNKWNYPGSISLQYEAGAFERSVESGMTQVPGWTHSDSLAAHTIIDDMLNATRSSTAVAASKEHPAGAEKAVQPIEPIRIQS